MQLHLAQKRPVQRLRLIGAILITLTLVAVAAAVALARPWQQNSKTVVSGAAIGQALRERWGIELTLVGVSAAGGMIDVRYKVVDTEKAKQMVGDPKNTISLIAERSGVELTTKTALVPLEQVEQGRIYFLLFPNVRNAIETGDKVTLVIGDTRYEHLAAR